MSLLEPKRPGVRDALDDEVSGIFDGRQRPGIEAGRRPIARRGRGTVEELVRSLVVVQVDNPTPIILSHEKSVIGGIHGSVVLSSCTRVWSSMGTRCVGAVSRRSGTVDR
jgi:hypothetical protein